MKMPERFIVDPTVEINLGEAKLLISPETLAELLLDRIRNSRATSAAPPPKDAPAIGAPWGGGIYAGVVRGDPEQRDYHLIVSAEEIDSATWDAARAWAKARGDDEVTWSLPQRKEQAILFGNVPELFEKEWYWSDAQDASAAGSAWAQGFHYGRQGHFLKGHEFRARAVRRLPI